MVATTRETEADVERTDLAGWTSHLAEWCFTVSAYNKYGESARAAVAVP